MTHHDKHDGGKQYIEAINAWRASKLPGWWSTFQALTENQREYLAATYPMVFGVISAAHLTAGQIGQYYAPTLGWSHEDEALVYNAIQPTLLGEPKRRDFR